MKTYVCDRVYRSIVNHNIILSATLMLGNIKENIRPLWVVHYQFRINIHHNKGPKVLAHSVCKKSTALLVFGRVTDFIVYPMWVYLTVKVHRVCVLSTGEVVKNHRIFSWANYHKKYRMVEAVVFYKLSINAMVFVYKCFLMFTNHKIWVDWVFLIECEKSRE